MAGWTGTRPPVWSGGLVCLASVGLLSAVLPKLMTYDATTDEDAQRRRVQKDSAAAETVG